MITTATMHCMPQLYFQAHRKPGHGPSARCRSDARRQSAACHGCGIFRPEPASACGAGTATGDCRRPAPAIRARFSLPSSSAPPAGRGTGHLSGLRCLLHIGHQGTVGGGDSGAEPLLSCVRNQTAEGRAGNSEKRPGPCALLQQRRTGLSSAPPARLVSGSHGRCPAPFARIVPPPALSGSGRSEPALPPSAVALAGGTLQLSCTWPDAGCRRTSLKAACSTSVAVNRGASRSALRLSAIWRITVSWSNVALKNEIIHPGKSLIFTGQLHGGAGNAPAAQPHQLT